MLDLFLGGWAKLGAAGAIAGVFLGYIGYLLARVHRAGYQKKELENARAARERLAKIKRAADARATGGVQSDPHNRDNRDD